jgi:hypothetical protein
MEPGARRQIDIDAKIALRPAAVRHIETDLNAGMVAIGHYRRGYQCINFTNTDGRISAVAAAGSSLDQIVSLYKSIAFWRVTLRLVSSEMPSNC